MTQRLAGYMQLPEDVKLRSPLRIAAERLTWSEKAGLAFRGRVTVAGGARLTLSAIKQPHELVVQSLTIEDGQRRARMGFRYSKDTLDLSFRGELAAQTIERLLIASPIQGSSLRGDIQGKVLLANPLSVSARGELDGSHVLIPLVTGNALLEKFRIEASGETILIKAADLRWGESRLAVAGRVSGANKVVRVDADISGDQIDWKKVQHGLGLDRKPQSQDRSTVALPAVEGVIRLKADRFNFPEFSAAPLETTVALSPRGISAQIGRAVVCGVSTTGRVGVEGRTVELDLRLAAKDAQLEPTTLCLTKQRSDIRGIYSLSARLAGREDPERLLSVLKGNFEINARDGEFVRSVGIDATFDYLNGTGDFDVNFPGLEQGNFSLPHTDGEGYS